MQGQFKTTGLQFYQTRIFEEKNRNLKIRKFEKKDLYINFVEVKC